MKYMKRGGSMITKKEIDLEEIKSQIPEGVKITSVKVHCGKKIIDVTKEILALKSNEIILAKGKVEVKPIKESCRKVDGKRYYGTFYFTIGELDRYGLQQKFNDFVLEN